MSTSEYLASADRTSATEPLPKALNNRFYRTVWRWHFYAGLFVIPFMLVLGITGTMHMDQYSGELLASVGWKDYGLVPRAVEMASLYQMGKYFGLANQLLMLFGALVTILLCASGTVLWWQRRPQGLAIGASPPPPYVQHWRIPLVIVAVLGFALPLMGLSLVAVLLWTMLFYLV